MSAQEDYERLEKALLEIETRLEPPRPRSRKAWTPRNEYRIAFRNAIQQFWQSTWSIAGVDEKTTMREAFWDGDDPQNRHVVVVRLDRRLWSLGFIGGHTLLEKMYPTGTQMSGRKDWDPRPPGMTQRDVDLFTEAYLYAAMTPFRTSHYVTPIAPDTLRRMRSDARDFVTQNWSTLRESMESLGPVPIPLLISDTVLKHSGSEFWYARNTPDENFWVMSYPQGKRLTERAQEYAPYLLNLGAEGKVYGPGQTLGSLSGRKDWDPRQKWNQIDLDMFTGSYIEAALWSSVDNNDEPLDKNYSVEDISPGTIKKLEDDAFEFLKQNWELVKMNLIVAGHDFWLTRNGHGAGFWDGDWPKRDGGILTKNSHTFGNYNLFVGDDNKVYGMSG